MAPTTEPAAVAASARRRHLDISYEEGPTQCPHSEADQKAEPEESHPLGLGDFAVLPEAKDNCAILRCRLAGGTRVTLFDGSVVTVTTTVLEGHRLAVVPIRQGEHLLSWGLPFGAAARDIAPGEYVCNSSVLQALQLRQIDGLPSESNFEDVILPHSVDAATFQPTSQVPLLQATERETFLGYDRADAQGGVGTRNFVVLVPTSALASPLARRVADSLQGEARGLGNLDGVVATAHTEAAGEAGGERPKNWDLLLRTLAGFVRHPNVAAALVLGYDGELLSPEVLKQYLLDSGMALPRWHGFLSLTGSFEEDMRRAREAVQPWLAEVAACERSRQPLAHLRVALQCGGSDSFSGVSGNPAAGVAAKYLIEHGGAAVLAETDELIGAESYILSRVANLETAEKFLHFVERFKERFAWHGQSAESNPSGGNKLRGLYNIALKSLGAAKKKHADVALDGVLDYSELLEEGRRGYFFLDSPGNDLESIAGQVACGCNAIFFITGNGSITNFPFVPTIKIITTSERYRLLENDMDFNAGEFQDAGVPMDVLGERLFAELVRVASGGRSVGERAGHSQVSIWREWALDGPGTDLRALSMEERGGAPLALTGGADSTEAEAAIMSEVRDLLQGTGGERLGLVLPTSLCSGEIARKAAEELNALLDTGKEELGRVVDRFVALPHTEGCGIGYSGDGEQLFFRVMLGHLRHASVGLALLLEHGCEKTHNAWMVDQLQHCGVDTSSYGLASVQLDGGINQTLAKVQQWFVSQSQGEHWRLSPAKSLSSPRALALLGERTGGCSALAASLLRGLVAAGGTVLIPSSAQLLSTGEVLDELAGGGAEASLAFAQRAEAVGAHIMHVPAGAGSRAEVVTGLVAAGAAAVVVLQGRKSAAVPAVGHPMVPVLHVLVDEDRGEEEVSGSTCTCDLLLGSRCGEDAAPRSLRWLGALASLLQEALSGKVRGRGAETVCFQVARGPTGLSA